MSDSPSQPSAEESALLQRAAAYPGLRDWTDLTRDELQTLAAEEGIDLATAVFYDRLRNKSRHVAFIKQIDQLRRNESVPDGGGKCKLLVAPGAFYREFPHTGSDGRMLRESADRLQVASAMIPSGSTGSLADNARIICESLAAETSERIILASVSKGGSDIKMALRRPEAAEAFRRVVAWINVGGLLDGSPMASWLLSRPLKCLFYRALFRLRGYDFRVISDLRWGAGSPLEAPVKLPEHITLINVIGVPLQAHLTHRITRNGHRRISPWGPSDGAILLADAGGWPGQIYPVWGADHYMRPSWQMKSIATALIRHAEQALAATGSPSDASRRNDSAVR